MRVRIFGKVTGERLAGAFYDTLEQIREVHPGCQVYTANLYLKLFDAQGHPIETVDHEGKPLVLTFPTPPGELNLPLAKPVQADHEFNLENETSGRVDASRGACRPFENGRDELTEEEISQHRRRSEELDTKLAREALLVAKFEEWVEVTARAIDDDPLFPTKLNQTFAEIWAEHEPVQAPGAKKGVLLSPPVFSYEVQKGKKHLMLKLSTWKAPRVCETPFGSVGSLSFREFAGKTLGPLDALDCFRLFSNHDAWRQACLAMMGRMSPSGVLIEN